jgi:hypothetical protein
MPQRRFASSHLLILAVDRVNGRTSISFFTVRKCGFETQNGYPGNVTTCTIWRQATISMLEGKGECKGILIRTQNDAGKGFFLAMVVMPLCCMK